MKGLTKRQSELLDFIQQFIKNRRYSPSYREIMDHFRFSSLGTVYRHIKVLKRKGVLSGEKYGGRAINVAEISKPMDSHGELELPFIGYITAGQPIETFPQSQKLAVPDFLVHAPDRTYALRVKGNSLNEELIADGDILLVEARNEAYEGETIVGLIDNHATIVKRYYPEGTYIRLEGGEGQKPLILKAEDLMIQGVVTGMLRFFL
jgi:repressor LexA